ncbi:MAG: N-acetyl sugar amidotransferase [Acholeplasmatales bacterium]|nr:N-acetyl sugar amidotransferase [Acholeplasmatales bacterium]
MKKENEESKRPYQICKCCVMDTSDEEIQFDENGVCMRCNEYKERILPSWNYGNGHEEELNRLIADIKKKGKNKKYDCILGLSGGLDSTYMLHLAVKEWGLRPFVFHIDAGWNLPVAESNIKRVTDRLGVELHVEKMDWKEMREMQLAWFKTGLENLDAPQDHAFIALIDKYSKKLGVKYILNGYNISTEIIADPSSWSDGYQTGDHKFMKDVVKKYCSIPIKKYTFTTGFRHKFVNPYIHHIRTIKPLNLVPITKKQMVETLASEYGYEPYGQKHFEDLITKFLEGYWVPEKFGHDIRRAQLSSLVVTGQITREEALKELESKPLSTEESKELFVEVARRLEISEDELTSYYNLPRCTTKFKNQNKFYNFGIRLYEFLGLEKRIRK